MNTLGIGDANEPLIVVEPLFSDSFISECRRKITTYNQSPARGIMHSFYTAISDARKISTLETQLRQARTAENCFEVLFSLARGEQKIGAQNFANMSAELRRSICQELKDKHSSVFSTLLFLANQKYEECDNYRANHDYGTGSYPSRSVIIATEYAANSIKNIAAESAPTLR